MVKDDLQGSLESEKREKKAQLEHTLTPYTKINSKWLKNLNIRHYTIKLLEENISKTLFDINHTNVFLGQSPKAIEIKAKINKLDLIKLIRFAHQRKPQTKRKDNLQTGRKYLQMMQLTRA